MITSRQAMLWINDLVSIVISTIAMILTEEIIGKEAYLGSTSFVGAGN